MNYEKAKFYKKVKNNTNTKRNQKFPNTKHQNPKGTLKLIRKSNKKA